MAIELITGVGADNHVSSNDFRAFNRANFGQGKYVLNDAENMNWFVSAPTGEITINTGSLMWSGMHIRNASNLTLTYPVPTSSTPIYIYLYYSKNTDTLIESVDFVVSVGKEVMPVVDNLSDNTITAYTLFGSFVATSSTASNFINGFQKVKNNEEIERLVAYAHEETVLFEGEARVNSYITLSESFRNFYELEFIGEDDESSHPTAAKSRVLVSQIDNVGSYLGVTLTGADKWNNAVDGFARFMPWLLQIKSDVLLETIATSRILIESSVSRRSDGYISKIIGIGRRN